MSYEDDDDEVYEGEEYPEDGESYDDDDEFWEDDEEQDDTT